MKQLLIIILMTGLMITGCRIDQPGKGKEIIIFHAGSLSVPFKELAEKYQLKNPGTKILLEPAGSLVCARKITELKKPCDIIASADYVVINEMIIPEYASWAIRFASNEIVIAYQEKSMFASEIDSANWAEVLLRKNVTFGRSDPDSDPCGYRTLMTFRLAEKYYNIPGLAEKIESKNVEFIRPKEVDLVALVESNALDYMFQYKSVAIQHNLKFIELPKKINLGDPRYNDIYNTVNVDVTGSTPGSRMTIKGEYINYSLAVLTNAANREDAIDFVSFLLGNEGMEIFRKNGQEPIRPFFTEQPEALPEKLKLMFNKDIKGG